MSAAFYASRRKMDWIGLSAVILAHLALLAVLVQARLVQPPRSLEPLFVHFVTPEAPPRPPEPVRREPPRPRVEKKPRPAEPPRPPEQVVVEAPAVPLESVAAPPPPPPVVEAPSPVVEALAVVAPVAPKSLGPVTLAEELSVSCPERVPPAYPLQSRRLKEHGRVLLRVELDEDGRVSAARIEKPSGVQRLDEAALTAVRGWRCNPARREGKPVPAIALQPFDFVLQ